MRGSGLTPDDGAGRTRETPVCGAQSRAVASVERNQDILYTSKRMPWASREWIPAKTSSGWIHLARRRFSRASVLRFRHPKCEQSYESERIKFVEIRARSIVSKSASLISREKKTNTRAIVFLYIRTYSSSTLASALFDTWNKSNPRGNQREVHWIAWWTEKKFKGSRGRLS